MMMFLDRQTMSVTIRFDKNTKKKDMLAMIYRL